MNYQEIVEDVLSQARLRKYGLTDAESIPYTLANYMRNMTVSEALYPVLCGVEVALRNRVQSALAHATGCDKWWAEERGILKNDELGRVKGAINRLRHQRKTQNVDRVVAELNLGFWVAMFDAEYEQALWHGPSLRRVFPNAPRSELGCHKVRAKLHRIRHLRNRVFHHEPIIDDGNLKELHAEILQLISWLSQDWLRIITQHDRFKDAFAVSQDQIRRRLDAL